MTKTYAAIIILITCAVIMNFVVLGILESKPSAQNVNAINVENPSPKVIARIIPSETSATSIPSTTPDDTNISNSSPSPNTDKLTITKIQTNLTAGSFLVSISNDDSSSIVITDIFVNDFPANLEKDLTIPANSNIKLLLTLTDGVIFSQTYQIRLQSSEGQSAIFYAFAY